MEQAVIVSIKLSCEFGTSEERNRVFEIEQDIMHILNASGAGVCDGHEFGEGFCKIYCYGVRADDMWEVIKVAVSRAWEISGLHVVKRYGPPGAKELNCSL